MINPRTDIDIPRYGCNEDRRVTEVRLAARGLPKSYHMVLTYQDHGRIKDVGAFLNYDDVAALVVAAKNWLEDQSS